MNNDTPQKRHLRQLAHMRGYNTGTPVTEGSEVTELKLGDKVIVYNKNGEPMMSGQVSDINENGDISKSYKIGDQFWSDVYYTFRYM